MSKHNEHIIIISIFRFRISLMLHQCDRVLTKFIAIFYDKKYNADFIRLFELNSLL